MASSSAQLEHQRRKQADRIVEPEQDAGQSSRDQGDASQDDECSRQGDQRKKPQRPLAHALVAGNHALAGCSGIARAEFEERIFQNAGQQDQAQQAQAVFGPGSSGLDQVRYADGGARHQQARSKTRQCAAFGNERRHEFRIPSGLGAEPRYARFEAGSRQL